MSPSSRRKWTVAPSSDPSASQVAQGGKNVKKFSFFIFLVSIGHPGVILSIASAGSSGETPYLFRTHSRAGRERHPALQQQKEEEETVRWRGFFSSFQGGDALCILGSLGILGTINRFFSAGSTASDTWDQGLREFDDDLRYRRELDCLSADHPGGLRLSRGE